MTIYLRDLHGALFSTVLLAVFCLGGLFACTSIVTPKLDELTGTTLAQRCTDYIATLRAYDAVSVTRVLDPYESAAMIGIKLFLAQKCPPVTPA